MSDEVVAVNPEPVTPEPKKHDFKAGVVRMGLWNVIHLGVGLLTMIGGGPGVVLIMGYPILCVVYGLPLTIVGWRKRSPAYGKGMLVAMCVALLLSCTCWVVVVGNMSFK